MQLVDALVLRLRGFGFGLGIFCVWDFGGFHIRAQGFGLSSRCDRTRVPAAC